MVKAMRASLEREFYGNAGGSDGIDHAGALLDFYLREIESGEKPALKALYNMACQTAAPALYHQAFERWQELHDPEDAPPDYPTAIRPFQVADRLAVGLGNDSVRETGITLHHAYGVPIIPGPALKGLARAHLRWWFENDEEFVESDYKTLKQTLFGQQDAAGYVTWHDAWYIPDSAPRDRPLALDVITPHHRGYYTGDGTARAWPTDFDNPTPVHFLSARGSYLAVLSGPNRAWADRGMELLTHALADWGAGGKTSSGYGRLMAAPEDTVQIDPGQTEPEMLQRISAIPSNLFTGQVRDLFEEAKALDEPQRSVALRAIRVKLLRSASRTWLRGKGVAFVEALDSELGNEDDSD